MDKIKRKFSFHIPTLRKTQKPETDFTSWFYEGIWS